MFLPELCCICYTVTIPRMDGNRLYFKYPENSTPEGPFNLCDPCMDAMRNKLDNASPGRFDILYDESKRVVFSIEREVPFTRQQADGIISMMATRNLLQVAYSTEVLPELMKKARLWMKYPHRPIAFRIDLSDIESTLAVFEKACNAEPAVQDANTTRAPSPTCISYFLQ